MKVTSQSLWRRAAAQAAIFALIFQTAFSIFGCPTGAHAGVSGPAGISRTSQSAGADQIAQGGVVCTAKGFLRIAANGGSSPAGGSDDTPQHGCPVCLTLCCHAGSAVTAPEVVLLPLPSVASSAIALEARQRPLGVGFHAFGNRGPPSSRA
jgi:hypothetical protein